MLKRSSKHTNERISYLLSSVGDMALKARAKNILENINLKPGQKVLEVGCGNGYYLSLLSRLKIADKLFGVDIDKRALADAKNFINNKHVKLTLAPAEKLPFKDNAFDRVVMSEVIEHVMDERTALNEVYRVLKPGGIFLLTTCNIEYPFLWDPVNWTLQHLFKTHIKSGFWAGIWNQHDRMYKTKDVNGLLEKAQFKILTIETLTSWCLPFNHYLVNSIARFFYAQKLPKSLSAGINKFRNDPQPILIRIGFLVVNLIDSLNDYYPQEAGVSIFVKARKA